MKKIIFVIIMISMYTFLFAEEDAESIDDTAETTTTLSGGFHAGISAFDYFRISAGVQLGQFRFTGHHSFASIFGISVEYQLPDILSLRGFYRAYGSSGGLLIGISVPVSTDFNTISIGISPEIGIGAGPLNLFYRYNFFINTAFSSHEICLVFGKYL